MAFAEEHCDPANIHSSNPRTRPIPPKTPPLRWPIRAGHLIEIRNAVRHDPHRSDRLLGAGGQPEDNEHYYLCKTLCKTGRYTKSFDGIQFSRQEFYDRSLIRVATVPGSRGGVTGEGILGFSNFWHKVRTPFTKLYFVVVDPDHQRQGVANALMEDLYAVCPYKALELDVNKDNFEAIKLYERHGFSYDGESLHGTCFHMIRKW